ncbi:MAG: DUF2922 domain-containing protein [Tissierellia bacterium]|nr:DUF2922 domain-containing protein [Tissierellia bacterium]
MEIKLKLDILNADGKTGNIILSDPKTDLTAEQIQAAEAKIVDAGALGYGGSAITSIKHASYVKTEITELY